MTSHSITNKSFYILEIGSWWTLQPFRHSHFESLSESIVVRLYIVQIYKSKYFIFRRNNIITTFLKILMFLIYIIVENNTIRKLKYNFFGMNSRDKIIMWCFFKLMARSYIVYIRTNHSIHSSIMVPFYRQNWNHYYHHHDDD